MGIDYTRMRLKPHIPQARILALVEAQAAAFHASGYICTLWVDDDDLPPRSDTDPIRLHYGELSRTLRSYLDVDEWYEGMDFDTSFRASPITNIDIFPIEWQRAAYRTYLPEQLPRQLQTWREYLIAVRQGRYRSYLLQRYLYEASVRLFCHWTSLQAIAQRSRTRTNAWTHTQAFAQARAAVDDFAPPQLAPAPLWSYWQHKPEADWPEAEQQYADLQTYKQALVERTREWDRHVPHGWKQRGYTFYELESFQTFLDLANDSWLEEFCMWVERCCKAHTGLFLDY